MWQTLNAHIFQYLFAACLLGQILVSYCESEHRTKAASEKLSELYCYKCDNIANEEECVTITENTTIEQEKCHKDQRICQVKTIMMSTPQENKTAPPKLWWLKRSCTKVCEPVCVTIGERTKVRACSTCCETNLCNTVNNSSSFHAATIHTKILFAIFIALVYILNNVQSQMNFVDDDNLIYAKKY